MITYKKIILSFALLSATSNILAEGYDAKTFSGQFAQFAASPISKKQFSGTIVVKFQNDSGVYLTEDSKSKSVFATSNNNFQNKIIAVNKSFDSKKEIKLSTAFSVPSKALKATSKKSKKMSGKNLPDLNSFFFIKIKNYDEAVSLIKNFYSNSLCETAYLMPTPPPPPTPDLSSSQTYFLPADDNGYDVNFAHSQPGGNGSNIRMIDIEYDWYYEHEDLQKTTNDILYATLIDLWSISRDHGTASLGISAALTNSFGMNGIIYAADTKMISSLDSSTNWLLHDAIYQAVSNSSPGDVILLEQQAVSLSNAVSKYCPVEYWPHFYAAIVNATAQDRIVIEPAGNRYGGNPVANLDDLEWSNIFTRSFRDSGAIIVGGGNPANRDKTSTSVYGSRVDIQGWGSGVASLGYGDLHNGGALSNEYTGSFSGTSSASALSAAIAASIQSYAKKNFGFYLTPELLRVNLISNGLPQGTGGHIGPLPNLSNSFLAVEKMVPSINQEALTFPTNNVEITAPALLDITWNIEEITDNIDNTNLIISEISLYMKSNTNKVIAIATDISNVLGKVEWNVPLSLYGGDTNFVLCFKVINDNKISSDRIFFNEQFKIVPEPIGFLICLPFFIFCKIRMDKSL